MIEAGKMGKIVILKTWPGFTVLDKDLNKSPYDTLVKRAGKISHSRWHVFWLRNSHILISVMHGDMRQTMVCCHGFLYWIIIPGNLRVRQKKRDGSIPGNLRIAGFG